MATDLVIRPIDGVISLVTDDREMAAEAVFIDRQGRLSIIENKTSRYIGRLLPSMRKLAAKCSRAVVVMMVGNVVADCRTVEFVNLGVIGER